ncbi:Cytochrome oxidase biogenesis protein Cox11-CtaG, copper delivery to Cox1 [hydrothermal vent metagenome]|uniref:Cytochrome oxidase biogenesis protein Cox11-CtaG, copper delivery to Cox1 n=1 Tax=hydrothermal vent metagenome TaxID=652676 RepID=A0A3B0Y905_9ZZZZ
MSPDKAVSANQKIIRRLLFAVVGMFGFGFAMVPLYDVFCDITGINGKTSGRVAVANVEPDMSRTVTVEFIASLNQSMPWDFRPEVSSMKVHPGKMYRTTFYAKNRTNKAMTGQAVPSVTPGLAARHFKKTECFCFTEQRFSAGEGRDMPLMFMVDRELPDGIEVVTLSYTFFEQQKNALN